MWHMRKIIMASASLALLLAGTGASGAQQQQLRTEWSKNVTEFRGQVGRRVTLVCPPQGQLGDVWGTDTYTDDSPVCVAAVHAGKITVGGGGAVTILIDSGRAGYTASARNGVASKTFGQWQGSFSFESSPPEGRLEWTTAGRGISLVNSPLTLECPPSGSLATAWGTDSYTDDSSICSAAVHAGVITTSGGGRVTLEATGPQSAFTASNRNGIISKSYGAWPDGFRFVNAPAVVATGSPGPAGTAMSSARTISPARESAITRARGAASEQTVNSVCRVYNSGTVYCRSVDDLLAKELLGTSADHLQATFAAVYQAQNLDLGAKGLVDCGSGVWTAVGQTEGSMPKGGDVQGMLSACGGKLGAKMPQRGVDGFLNPLAGTRPEGRAARGRSGSSCGTGKANPMLAAADGGNLIVNLVTERSEVGARARVNQDHYVRNTLPSGKQIAFEVPYSVLKEEYRDAARQSKGQAKAALEQLAETADMMDKEQKAQQGSRDASGNITGGRTSPEGSTCSEVEQQLAALMDECARNGGNSYQCQKLNSCGGADPALIQPLQTSDGAVGACGNVEITGGEENLREALIMQCEASKKPGPDGTPNCGGWRSQGTTSQAANLCGNPYALVSDSCLEANGSSVGFMTLQRSLQSVLDKGHAMVGGPRITVGGGGTPRPMGPRNQSPARVNRNAPSISGARP